MSPSTPSVDTLTYFIQLITTRCSFRQVLRATERGVRVRGAAVGGAGGARGSGDASGAPAGGAAPCHHTRQLPTLSRLPRQTRTGAPVARPARLLTALALHRLNNLRSFNKF